MTRHLGVLLALVLSVSISARGPHEGEVGGARPPRAGVAGRQLPPSGLTPRVHVWPFTAVPDVGIGIPKYPGQLVSRPVDTCGLTASSAKDYVCLSVWVIEPQSDTGIAHVWIKKVGSTAKETNGGGVVTWKIKKQQLVKLVMDTPEGYGTRPNDAPGAPYQVAIPSTPISVRDWHVCVIVELWKRADGT